MKKKAFEFDTERTLDAMAYSSNIDLMYGQVTLFAIVCIGSDDEHFSHGGMLTLDANEAIETARHQNQEAFEEGMTCRYLPAAVGLDPSALFHLANLTAGAIVQEPGDDELG